MLYYAILYRTHGAMYAPERGVYILPPSHNVTSLPFPTWLSIYCLPSLSRIVARRWGPLVGKDSGVHTIAGKYLVSASR